MANDRGSTKGGKAAAGEAAAEADAEAGKSTPRPHPLDSAGCFSRMSIAWLSSLVWLSNRRQLQEEDVWQLPHSFRPSEFEERFLAAWTAETAAAEARHRQASVVRAVFHAFGPWQLASGLLLFLCACVMLAQPLLIRRLVDYLNAAPSSSVTEGIAVASAVFGCSAASSLLFANYSRLAHLNGLRAKAALARAAFRHALDLSASARAVGSVGQTTNLMAIDTEKLYEALRFFHFVWMGPLSAVLVGTLLVSALGLPALAGLALVVVQGPLQFLLTKYGGLARKRALTFTDARVKFVTEVVHGIRVVKLCAWEEAVFKRAAGTRRSEVGWLVTSLFLKAVIREGIIVVLPPAALAIIFALERARGVVVDWPLALMALGLLNALRFPSNVFAAALAWCQDGLVSCGRLGEFLRRPTLSSQQAPETGQLLVEVSGARFLWRLPEGQAASFQLTVPKLQLSGPGKTAVLGRVASGKTSLLAGLLGEMQQVEGHSALRGRVAFMGQTPWVQNLTLRDNVLFGLPLDEERYWQAVTSAALASDLEVLQDGDLTEIGERGINLSGGQKARVGLARCLYAVAMGSCNVLILDCPFDALDVATGQQIFDGMESIAREALLVCAMSSQVHLLPRFDQVVVVEEGQVSAAGAFAEVAASHPELVEVGNGVQPTAVSHWGSAVQQGHATATAQAAAAQKSQRKKNEGASSLARKDVNKAGGISVLMALSHLGEAVKGGPAAGACVGLALMAVFLVGQGLRVVSDVLLTAWGAGSSPGLALGTLAACAVLVSMRVWFTALVSRQASAALYRRTFWHLLRAPVAEYFDVTTSGEIINKFAKDLETTDTMLPETTMNFFSNSSILVCIVALNTFAIPWFLAVLALLSVVFVYVGLKFKAVSRDLKRMDGSTSSPVYSSFSETLTGLETIRAWRAQERFQQQFAQRQEHNFRFKISVAMAESWVMARLESVSFAIIGAFAFSAVAMRESADPQIVGLALTYSVQLTAMLQRTVQMSIQLGQHLTSCERVRSFEKVPQEPALVKAQDAALPKTWPCGGVTFEGVKLRYRHGDLVLKGVSFAAQPGERVGICGRTGAGKSSLLAVLFRLAEPCGGAVHIDGVDISTLGLRTLRSKLSIIPQEPVIFSGSLRSNLDPFGTFSSDEPLVDAMCRIGLQDFLQELGLEGVVAEQGKNLSQGQRQLLCVARATLRRARVTALDEATSAMDAGTDRLVQRALAEHWRAASGDGGSMLTIAHRLSTILDYDRILVLSFGEVAEFDTPARLLADEASGLSRMLRDEPAVV